jgi:hypothetical protein
MAGANPRLLFEGLIVRGPAARSPESIQRKFGDAAGAASADKVNQTRRRAGRFSGRNYELEFIFFWRSRVLQGFQRAELCRANPVCRKV